MLIVYIKKIELLINTLRDMFEDLKKMQNTQALNMTHFKTQSHPHA